MTDVNEEIVRQYFELRGYFVQTDVLYLKPKGKTGKESSGYGDIDLVILNPSWRRVSAIFMASLDGGCSAIFCIPAFSAKGFYFAMTAGISTY